jgi:hypothetical protein
MGMLNANFLHWGLTGAALAVAFPRLASGGIYVAFYTAGQFKISARQFFHEAVRAPLLCAVPFLGVLIGSRALFGDRPLIALLAGGTAATLVLIPSYWRWVMPESLRDQARALVSRLRRIRAS